MTAEPPAPAQPDQPKHPLHAMTTYELSRYRGELEQSLKALPTQVPVRAELQDKLAQVKAEQESRLNIAADPRR
jgi:hypothetical protein